MSPEIVEHAERALKNLSELRSLCFGVPANVQLNVLTFELGWLTGKVSELEQANGYLRSTIARLVDDAK